MSTEDLVVMEQGAFVLWLVVAFVVGALWGLALRVAARPGRRNQQRGTL